MSHFELINAMRLVRVGPGLRERIARKWMVARLVAFREQLAQEMAPEPWTALEAPAPAFLADLCAALDLSEDERKAVLGLLGRVALGEHQQLTVHPGRARVNDRQAKALAHAEANGGIDAGAFRALCPHWSPETLRVDLARLVKIGLLVKVGRTRGTRYTVPKEVG